VILLHNVVQVFTLANLNPLVFVSVVLFDSRSIGTTFVYIDQAGFAVGSNRFV